MKLVHQLKVNRQCTRLVKFRKFIITVIKIGKEGVVINRPDDGNTVDFMVDNKPTEVKNFKVILNLDEIEKLHETRDPLALKKFIAKMVEDNLEHQKPKIQEHKTTTWAWDVGLLAYFFNELVTPEELTKLLDTEFCKQCENQELYFEFFGYMAGTDSAFIHCYHGNKTTFYKI